MKKISLLALTFIMTAGLLTACRMPSTDDATVPSTTGTKPTTATTAPTTIPTVPATMPTVTTPSATEATDATNDSENNNTTKPSEGHPGKNRRMAPGR